MSLLLLLYEPGIGPPPPTVDQYVRLIDSWELSYALGSTAVFRCVLVDPRTDRENAFRPANDYRVEIRRLSNQPIFRGRIVSVSDAPLEEPNVGTRYSINCIGESEVFESRFVTATFGSDPIPIQITYASSGGVAQATTQDVHGLAVGDEVTFSGVSPDGGATFSSINGDKVVQSVIDPYNFTVTLGTNVQSYGGTVRKRVRLRTIVQALETPYLDDYGYSVATDMLAGPLLEVQKFDNASINDIFRHLSKITGWVHRYLPNRVVEWFEPGTKLSDLKFVKSNVMGGTGWTQSRIKKANTVILKYGGDQQIATVETITGNGVKREWPLTHKPVVTRPITSTSAQLYVSVPEGDGGAMVQRHVGIYGYDTLFEWVYRESDNTLVQLDASGGGSNPVKPLGWAAVVYATEQLPGTVREVDPGIGTAPIREKLIEAKGIIDRNAAIQLAKAELNGLSVTPKESKLVTEAGLTWPGNSSEVELPHILMTGQFLITGVSAVETERAIRYTYTAIEGNEFTSTWQEKLRSLFGGGGSGESSVLSGSITTLPGGSGGGGTVLGTAGKIPVFTSVTTLGDSVLEQSPDGNLVSTPAAIQATQGFRSNVFQGVTDGAVDAVFRNAAAQAVFDVPTGTRDARFYGDVVTDRVYSEADLTLGSPNNVVYPEGNYQTHLGGISRKWLTVHAAELWVEQLVAQETISTIGGSILVAPTTTLEADLPLAATSILVKHNQFANGDRVMMKGFGKFEVMIITSAPSGTGPYLYTVTRNYDGSGANDWFAGDAVVNTQGSFIDIYAMRGTKSALEKGPTLVGNVRTGTAATAWEPRWALGNLNGVYGYATDIYGFVAGVRTGAWVSVEPTNGFRIMFNNTVFAQIDAAGAASFTGSVTVTGGNAAKTDLTNVTGAAVQGKTGWGHPSDTTLINGANIFTGTVTLSKLNFTPVQTSNVVASINASAEGIRISGNKIQIDGTVSFSAGYDPSTKLGAGGAAADVNANVTTISGGKITTGTITADRLNVGSLAAITVNTGALNITGVLTINSSAGGYITGGAYTLTADGGLLFQGANGDWDDRSIRWDNGCRIIGRSDVGSLHLRGPGGGQWSQINLYSFGTSIWGGTGGGRETMFIDNGSVTPGGSGINMGGSSDRWANIYGETINFSSALVWTAADSQGAGIGRVIVVASDGVFHAVNNGYTGFSGGLNFANGICTGP